MKITKPRYLKSHECFDPQYKKVIYIVRDPRDVAISTYYFHIKMNNISTETTLEQFVVQYLNGQTSIYGSWFENVGSWLGAKKDNMLVLRYEDLLKDGAKELTKISDFLKIDVQNNELIERALINSSFENMRSLEKKQGSTWKPLLKSRHDMRFVRSGKSNQWKDELSIHSQEQIWYKCSDLMQRFGYNK